MLKLTQLLSAAIFFAGLAGSASAATITLDLNGFPNESNGQVSGPGLDDPIPLPADKQQIELPNLGAGSAYQVDFFHNSGENGSDFLFTINAAGTGVEKVQPAAKKFMMVKDFRRGLTTLKLNTHTVIYNANSGQTGQYYIHGLLGSGAIKPNKGPIKLVAAPGVYRVDNLYNSGLGNEDFNFIVGSSGKTSAGLNGGEYAEFSGSSVSPRSANVHFQITSSSPVAYHGTQNVFNATNVGNVYDLDMTMTIGSSGLNIWSFGRSKVTSSDIMAADGKPLKDSEGINDFHFCPRLRYNSKKGFFFETTQGSSDTVKASVVGSSDDGATGLEVTVTATIERKDNSETK